MSDNSSNTTTEGWSFGSFFESIKKASNEVSKKASTFVDKSMNEAIKILGDIKTKGEEMYKEIDAKENQLKKETIVVLPWELPEFKNTMYASMLKDDIMALSNDSDTFLKAIEGGDTEEYSAAKNVQLVNLLREQDKKLQNMRFIHVQKEAHIDDDHFWKNYLFRVFQIVNNYKNALMEDQLRDSSKDSNPSTHVSTEPIKRNNAVESVKSAEPAEPAESIEPAESVKPTKFISPNEVTKPIESTKLAESVKQEVKESIAQKEEKEEKNKESIEISKEDNTKVPTLDDIYDFDEMSDIEKEIGDISVDMDEDIDVLEAEILSEL